LFGDCFRGKGISVSALLQGRGWLSSFELLYVAVSSRQRVSQFQ
jgi:hypothetical protein